MHRALSSCHNSVKPVPHEPSFGTLYSKASLTLSHKPRDFSRWALPPVTALTNNESFLRLVGFSGSAAFTLNLKTCTPHELPPHRARARNPEVRTRRFHSHSAQALRSPLLRCVPRFFPPLRPITSAPPTSTRSLGRSQ